MIGRDREVAGDRREISSGWRLAFQLRVEVARRRGHVGARESQLGGAGGLAGNRQRAS